MRLTTALFDALTRNIGYVPAAHYRLTLAVTVFSCAVATGALAQTGTAAQQQDAPPEPGLGWRDRPTIELGGNSRLELRARIQSEFVLRDDTADAEELSQERFSFPRRRFGVTGELFGRLEFQAERDMADDGVWRDLYADFRWSRELKVRAGQFKVPFSREQLTSVYDLEFAERSTIVRDLVPLREVGVMAHGVVANRAVKYEVGLFDGSDTRAGRVTVSPLPDGNRLGSDQLEISAAWRRSPLAEGRTGAEGNLFMGERFFNRIYANGTRTLIGAGAKWHVPQLTLAGELIRAADTRLGQAIDNGDLSDLVARGGYASAVWHVIHGKGRRRGPAPFRELDVSGRVDWLRFSSANTADEAYRNPRAIHVAPLEKRTVTMGVTWHLNRWMRVQTNVVREQLQDALGVYPVAQTPVWSALIRSQVVM
jgi:phosphate-selective porin